MSQTGESVSVNLSDLLPLLAGAAGWALLAGAVSSVVAWVLLATPLGQQLLDRPNARSLHARATPRAGGVGIVAGIVVVGALGPAALPGAVWAALLGVALVSLLDDARGLPAALRLLVHLAAAGLAVQALLPAAPVLLWAVAALGTAWAMNLYNFMDGSDGLAGGQAVFGFGALACAALWSGEAGLAALALGAAGAAAGFLLFNLPPARLFMGDAGSVSLGLWAAVLGLAGVARGVWDAWFPLLAFLPFVLDASATLLDRLRRRQRVWHAHRDHAYQRLNLAGLGHRRTAALYYGLMACSAALALALHGQAVGWWAGLGWAGLLMLLYVLVLRRCPGGWQR
jgi:UDP-N-acetylmuramyl pentapeptide phosphotransferase/UDP-N-acetylglucosamine-1-phosphate transferase